MKNMFIKLGVIIHWLARPAIYVYLYGSRRTRVLVIHDGKVLLTKSWLGDGNWHLPGGGLHKNEDPKISATREVFEETNMQLAPEQLNYLYDKKVIDKNWLKFHYYAYYIELDVLPAGLRPRSEVMLLNWIDLDEAKTEIKNSSVLPEMIDAWKAAKLSMVK